MVKFELGKFIKYYRLHLKNMMYDLPKEPTENQAGEKVMLESIHALVHSIEVRSERLKDLEARLENLLTEKRDLEADISSKHLGISNLLGIMEKLYDNKILREFTAWLSKEV